MLWEFLLLLNVPYHTFLHLGFLWCWCGVRLPTSPMRTGRAALIVGTSALTLAIAYHLLRRRRSSKQRALQRPVSDCQHKVAAAGASQPRKTTLYVFHCGEQPMIVEQFRLEANDQCFEVHVDTLDRFEAWVHNVRDWVDNRSSACGRAPVPPPCILIVNTGEELTITSKAAAACLLFLNRSSASESGNRVPLLDGFRYAVCGLGDSNHLATSHRSISWASGKDCNQCGELFERWLEQLGGTRIVRRGESDLRTDHEALAPWMSGLWTALKSSTY